MTKSGARTRRRASDHTHQHDDGHQPAESHQHAADDAEQGRDVPALLDVTERFGRRLPDVMGVGWHERHHTDPLGRHHVRLIAALQLRPPADARLHAVLDRERRNLGVLAEHELVDEAQRVIVLKESPLSRSLIGRLAASEQFKGRKLQGSGFERGLVGNDAHLLVVQHSARQDEREGLSHPTRRPAAACANAEFSYGMPDKPQTHSTAVTIRDVHTT